MHSRLHLFVSCLAFVNVTGEKCRDLGGPWPCREEGCPTDTVNCAMLQNDCEHHFSKVWRTPPAGLEDTFVWQQCPKTWLVQSGCVPVLFAFIRNGDAEVRYLAARALLYMR